jgi:hypothetical protein
VVAVRFDVELAVDKVFWGTCLCFPLVTCGLGLLCLPCALRSAVSTVTTQTCTVERDTLVHRCGRHTPKETRVPLAAVRNVVAFQKWGEEGLWTMHVFNAESARPAVVLYGVQDAPALRTLILARRDALAGTQPVAAAPMAPPPFSAADEGVRAELRALTEATIELRRDVARLQQQVAPEP